MFDVDSDGEGTASDDRDVLMEDDADSTMPVALPVVARPIPVIEVNPTTRTMLNEFTHNKELFLGAFPWLFPFGTGVEKDGGKSSLKYRNHVFRQFSCAFAEEPWYLFLTMNQLQRHCVSQRSCQIRSHPESLRALSQFLQDDESKELLARAVKNPDGAEAKKLVKKVEPFLKVVSARVPFTEGERGTGISHMHSCCHQYAAPTHFLTFAMDDLRTSYIVCVMYYDTNAMPVILLS
jgi:hypothetical protein